MGRTPVFGVQSRTFTGHQEMLPGIQRRYQTFQRCAKACAPPGGRARCSTFQPGALGLAMIPSRVVLVGRTWHEGLEAPWATARLHDGFAEMPCVRAAPRRRRSGEIRCYLNRQTLHATTRGDSNFSLDSLADGAIRVHAALSPSNREVVVGWHPVDSCTKWASSARTSRMWSAQRP